MYEEDIQGMAIGKDSFHGFINLLNSRQYKDYAKIYYRGAYAPEWSLFWGLRHIYILSLPAYGALLGQIYPNALFFYDYDGRGRDG